MGSRQPRDANSIKTLRKQLLIAVQSGQPQDACCQSAFEELLSRQERDGQTTLEWLSLLCTTARYVSTFKDDPTLTDTVHEHLVPAFRPEGSIISQVQIQLGSSSKPHTARANEALTAIGHLSTALPPPSTCSSQEQNFLVPFFSWLCSKGLKNKADLAAGLCLIDRLPDNSLPEELLHRLLDDLSLSTYPNLRSLMVAKLLSRRSDCTPNALVILLPLLEEGRVSETTSLNVSRHLLPTLFRENRDACSQLLGLLESPAGPIDEQFFAAWIAVASAGMSEGILDLEGLPYEALSTGTAHHDPDVRLRAFRLIAMTKDILSSTAVELVKLAFSSNVILSSLDSRSSFISTSRTLFTNMQLHETTVQMASRKLAAGLQTKKTALSPSALEAAKLAGQELHEWIINVFVTPALADSRHPPVARALLALGVLEQYLAIFGSRAEVQQSVFTLARVAFLIGCQASDYTEVRARAKQILESASLPLPGYEYLEAQASSSLLADSLDSLCHPRRTQAEAGKSTLCIIFTKLVYEKDDELHSRSRAFVDDLLNQLEDSVKHSELDLVSGMDEHPFHGQLSALHDLLEVVDVDERVQSLWESIYRKINNLVHRIWAVTRRVISLKPNEDGAEHEIARAYTVLGVDEGGEADEEGPDHTGILSGCFRVTSNASELLCAIFARPLRSPSSAPFWSREEVDSTGQTFLTWLHDVRHRGTFTRIANSFAILVGCIRQHPLLESLPAHWLELELHAITLDDFSITRRSAGLPYSVLALTNGNAAMFDIALTRLLSLAQLDHPSSDVTKVHCFNILKIVLLDAKHSRFVDKYFERAVIAALRAFGSPDWNVRNAGQILFSTLVHRSLGNAKTSQDMLSSRAILATRQTFASWIDKYPSLLPYLAAYVQQLPSSPSPAFARHSALFPVLIIIRSLRWSKEGEAVQEELSKAVLPFLASHEWQVREVAAQAMSALADPDHATKLAMSLCSEICDATSNVNAIHGRACFLNLLAQNVIEWSQLAPTETESFADEICAALSVWTTLDVPLVATELVKAVDALLSANPNVSRPTTVAQAVKQIKLALRPSASVGHGLLQDACAAMLLRHADKDIAELLSGPTVRLALQALPVQPSVSDPRTLRGVMSVVCAIDLDFELQVDALHALCETRWCANVLDTASDSMLAILIREMERVLGVSSCVQIREASLPVLSWALSQMAARGMASNESLQGLAATILRASHEDQSEPSRSSSMRALRPLAKLLFPGSPDSPGPLPDVALQMLHQSLLCLLQDDDEDIREGAAEIVSTGLGEPRCVHERVIDSWWTWARKYMLYGVDATSWVDWMSTLCTDIDGLNVDLKRLQDPSHADVLFEVEPPNLYRNPLDDASRAAGILTAIPVNDIPEIVLVHAYELRSRALGALAQARQTSPIDDAWEASRCLHRRVEILNVVLQREGLGR